ncbi:unnamed protein product [Paramecium octaurelia]|uniref:Major facilitator superfamily (MFS) profile domain-containing protein n=1 Tax=Paramecium octaurelia TaxID=43137 RepID=A0A8S1X1J2_PAROT|nr:unnamed protein product [Paramecium octaurelia]
MKTNISENSPKVNSLFQVVLMNVNIQLGALNIGYVLSYLTLTIDTLFDNLGITKEERTSSLSVINGILPLGCVVGVIIGYFLKRKFTNKQCIHIADLIGLSSLLAVIANTNVVIVFRFFLGVANGISSLIMPVYVKSLCPEKYYYQISMILGYGVNTGLAIGQLMGIGYIKYHGETSNWWRIVFLFPAIIFIIRSTVIYFCYNYDSPEQSLQRNDVEHAKYVIKQIYKEEYLEAQLDRYRQIAQNEQFKTQNSFLHIFQKKNLIGLQVGVISMFVQIWCGSFAVFYYSAQIFEQLSGGDLVLKTIYTICIGLFSAAAQFTTIPMLPRLGQKYILIIGSVLMGAINITIAVLSNYQSDTILFLIFVFLVLLIMVFAATLSPVCWGIVPQLNDSDGTFFTMDLRWIFQAILIFSFPYIVQGVNISGAFYIFGGIDLFYTIYCGFFILDSRGKTGAQILEMYFEKYSKFLVLPQTETNP